MFTGSSYAATKGGFAMAGTWHRHTFYVSLMAIVTAMGLLANPAVGAAQSTREADGARLLKGALDLHFHMDPWTPGALNGQAGIAEVRLARSRGMRGLLIKDHNEPTAPLAYHLRQEMPSFALYGGLDDVGAFAAAMRAHGFTDSELDLLFKENPAKALGLTPIP